MSTTYQCIYTKKQSTEYIHLTVLSLITTEPMSKPINNFFHSYFFIGEEYKPQVIDTKEGIEQTIKEIVTAQGVDKVGVSYADVELTTLLLKCG